MVKISNAFSENEIHRADSPFNEDSKNIIFIAREALISEGGTPRKFMENGENSQKQGNLLLRKLRSAQF